MNHNQNQSPFDRLLSIEEAARIWGKDSSTIRRAILDGRLIQGVDCKKIGKQWIITVDAMARLYPRKTQQTTIEPDYSPWEHYNNN